MPRSQRVLVLMVSAVVGLLIYFIQYRYVNDWVRGWKPISATGYGGISALLIFLIKTWLDADLHQAEPYPANQALSIIAWLGGVAALISAAVSAASGGGVVGNSFIVWGVSLLLLGLTADVIARNLNL